MAASGTVEQVIWQDPIPAADEPPRKLSNLDLVDDCDNFPYFQSQPDLYTRHVTTYYHLKLPSHTATFGFLLPSVAAVLRNIPAWSLDDDALTLTLLAGDDPALPPAAQRAARSAAVAATTAAMRETGHFAILAGWRDELYPVYDASGAVVFDIERSASALFGVVTYGCHLNAHVGRGAGMRVWIPRRAYDKSTYPGMLDNTVAGGLATGETPWGCLLREAEEEASLPEELVRATAVPVGTVTYFHVRDERAGGETRLLQPECQYVYDLELEDETSVVPKPGDDEVAGFELMGVEEAKAAMARGEFKPNCALVLLDFFVRHGILNAGNEKDYVEIVSRLHRKLEFPTAK